MPQAGRLEQQKSTVSPPGGQRPEGEVGQSPAPPSRSGPAAVSCSPPPSSWGRLPSVSLCLRLLLLQGRPLCRTGLAPGEYDLILTCSPLQRLHFQMKPCSSMGTGGRTPPWVLRGHSSKHNKWRVEIWWEGALEVNLHSSETQAAKFRLFLRPVAWSPGCLSETPGDLWKTQMSWFYTNLYPIPLRAPLVFLILSQA